MLTARPRSRPTPEAVARPRTRPAAVPEVARARQRPVAKPTLDLGPLTPKPAVRWFCEANEVTDNMLGPRLVALGEVNPKVIPSKWAGWPNGSLVGKMSDRNVWTHKGRFLYTRSGKIHVLRWHAFQSRYLYVVLARDMAHALSVL